MTETNNNVMTHLKNTSSEEIRDMFEQDIATTARQACDLRHPNVILSVTDLNNERLFEAYFSEQLSEDDHQELTAQLRHNFGKENIHFTKSEQVKNCHVYKVILHVSK